MYQVCCRIRRKGANFSAILYLAAVYLFLTLPFPIYIVALFRAKLPEVVYIPILLLYCLGVYIITTRSLTKKQFKEALVLFNKESRAQRIIGNIIAVLLVLLSPILFMCILWVLAHFRD